MEIDFSREEDYLKAVEGFKTLGDFDGGSGALHIVIEDGNVEDSHLIFCYSKQEEITEEEIKFLDLLKSLPYSMRYAAYLE